MTLNAHPFDRSRSKAWGREAAALVVSAVFFSVTALHAAERAPVCEAEKNFNNQQLVWADDYADMPYLVKLPDGRLGMTITVGADREGASEQHVVWLSSRDNGATWSEPISLEPPGGPEASWAMPFVKDSRLYVVYAYNTRNRRAWPLSDGGARTRVDMLGDMARSLAEGVVADYEAELPSTVACFQDDFEACIAHLRMPIPHRRAIRTTNLLERLFVEERRRLKIIPNPFGEKPVRKLMFGAMIRAAERWRPIKVTDFERRHMAAVRQELDHEYEARNSLDQKPSANAHQPKLSSTSRT